MALHSTDRVNEVVATLPGKRAVRLRLVWREITLHDGRRVTVCEHRYPDQTPSAAPTP